MLSNYLRIAFRNLWRSKGFSFLNLAGLAVGMASAILILLWIYNESTYDNFHRNKDRIYLVYNRGIVSGKVECWNLTPNPLAPILKKDFTGIAAAVRTDNRWFVTRVGEKKVSSHALVADSGFLSMFSFPMVAGNPATALNAPSSIVITQEMAKKFFGNEDAMNKTIVINMNHFMVTGILKDLPSNSNFQFEFIIPWSYQQVIGMVDDTWNNNPSTTYVMLQPGVTEAAMDGQIVNITRQHSSGKVKEQLFLHPLRKWHTYDQFENGVNSGGFITTLRLFGVIAAFILLVACINFMNLSTARSERRAREVGIRKVAGAYRSLLIAQFLGESIIMAFLAGILALILVQFSLPAFDTLVRKQLTMPYSSPWFYGLFLLFILLTGSMAGSYPAFFLSSFRPVAVLKGSFKRSHARINPRKVLVVLQFSFAILLIIGTLIVVQQIRYGQDRATGYDHNRLVYQYLTGDLNDRYATLRNQLLSTGVVASLTRSGSPMTLEMSDTWDIQWEGKSSNDRTDFARMSEDEGLARTAGLQILQGRDMDLSRYPTDSTAILLNESAVKAMGFSNPIGQTIRDNDANYHVVGVIKDFLMGSPYDNMQPMIVEGLRSHFINVVNMRLADGHGTAQSLEALRKVFTQLNPDFPFEYHFVDDDYAQKFADTQSVAILSGLFAGLTIFISCLGLFGLAAYMAEARIKEIGVRKVLGASVLSITSLLTREFVALVFISFVVASPLAWFAMNSWLQNFEYRIHISVWIFVLAGGLSILISLLTVGYQAVAAACANPAKSLRPE